MGKRSTFARRAQDSYDTPGSATMPLLPHLPACARYVEPCVGWGDLVETLDLAGHRCVLAFDVAPRSIWRWGRGDALDFRAPVEATHIITNPPWSRPLLHAMIEAFRVQRPTWLLFDADWMHTKQAAPHLRYCRQIVSVGRVSWMGNGTGGKDNAAWYLFGDTSGRPFFAGRDAA